MVQKTCIRYLTVLVGLLVASGCSETSDCEVNFKQKFFEQSLNACKQHYAQSQTLESLTLWIESLGKLERFGEMVHALDDVESEAHRAKVHTIAARYEYQRNNLEVAEKYYQAAVDIYRQTNMHSELAKSLHQLYFLAWQQSKHRAAISYASESLKAARVSGSDVDEIIALNDLFTIFQEVGNLGPAQEALSLIKSKLGDDLTSPRRINAYINEGLLNIDKNQFGLASHNFESALAIAKDSKNKDALRGLHLNIVESNLALGRMDRAGEHLKKAWSYARPDGSKRFALLFYQSQFHFLLEEYQLSYDALTTALNLEDLPQVWSWRIHYWIGQSARRLNNHSQAIASYNLAIENSENLREEMALSELKAHSIARRRQPYEALFLEHFNANNVMQAFTISERAKNRSFTDSFIHNSETAMSDATEFRPFTAAADRVESLQLYLGSMRASSTSNIHDGGTIVSGLSGKNILSFFIAEQRLFAMAIANGSLDIVEIEVEYEKLLDLVDAHREKPNSLIALNSLGELLLPAKLLPSAGEHLYVSPDTLFANISIPSLRVDSGFLIERYTLSLIPSANSLMKNISRLDQVDRQKKFIVVGDPLGDLPSANSEVQAVSQLLNIEAYIGESANLDNILEAPTPDLLHLATHSGINHLGPWLKLNDGEISGSALLRENFTPRLAVLASCASGAGNDNHVWGSLGGLFLAKGTLSVLAAFRSIEDRYTTKIMLKFYAQLKNHSSSAEALAFSQREAIKRGEAPELWGSFVLLGMPLHLF